MTNRLQIFQDWKVKVSNPQKNISPILAEVTENVQSSITKYSADATFGFAGNWQIELEAQREQNSNENTILIYRLNHC